MGLKHKNYSDYGSVGSSSNCSSWISQQDIQWSGGSQNQNMECPNQKSSSYSDLIMGRCTLDDVMRDFQMNGSDSPYNPDEDKIWGKNTELPLSGMGPPSAYLRQRSWPAPERSPAAASHRLSVPPNFATSTPIFDNPPAFVPEAPVSSPVDPTSPASPSLSSLTEEQSRVLNSLPQVVLQSLLKHMNNDKRRQECRFCKNNGERETYYRSHMLKDASGRVACPVLRAFVCVRCGARGDRAHTIKYCPLSTNEERLKSAAMMRSVRLASGRRRSAQVPPSVGAGDYIMFGNLLQATANDISAKYDQQRAVGDGFTKFNTPHAAGDGFTKSNTPHAAVDVFTNFNTPRATGDASASFNTPFAVSDASANFNTPLAAGNFYANYDKQRAKGDVFANSEPRGAGGVFTDIPLDPLWAALEQKLML